jgi:hypothetical protein
VTKPAKQAPPVPCPALILTSFVARGEGAGMLVIAWTTKGGCAPFQGFVGWDANINGHDSVRATRGSGSVQFAVCQGGGNLQVTAFLDLYDFGGHHISPNADHTFVTVSC